MTSSEDEVVPATAMLLAVMNKKGEKLGVARQFVDRLLLLRHGERQDHAARAWRGSTHLPPFDPPLSNDGRQQCLETALHYRALRRAKGIEVRADGLISLIVTSPFQRCLETAIIVNVIGFDGALAIFVDPQLSDWQQSRIYRAAPELAGHYTPRVRPRRRPKVDSAPPELRFCPHRDALRTSLTPFFQSLLTTATPTTGNARQSDGLSACADEAQHWLTCLQQWLARHHSLPVWTSPSAAMFIHDALSASTTPVSTASTRQRTARRSDADGKSQTRESTSGEVCMPQFAQCGVAFPENRNELRARCFEFLHTHFGGDDKATLAQVPRLVLAAVQRERTAHLPRYFATYKELPAPRGTATTGRALLPPMHTLVVTHADVIATMLSICCPRHHANGVGFSVPYCSLTLLTRSNRFYYAVKPHERNGASSGQSQRPTAQIRNDVRTSRALPTPQLVAAASVGSVVSSDVRDDWQAVKVGATDLLRTRIVIQFNK